MKAVAYAHSTKESMYDLGESLGLKDGALGMFKHALTEVRFEIEIDPETGQYKILTVDGLPVVHPPES